MKKFEYQGHHLKNKKIIENLLDIGAGAIPATIYCYKTSLIAFASGFVFMLMPPVGLILLFLGLGGVLGVVGLWWEYLQLVRINISMWNKWRNTCLWIYIISGGISLIMSIITGHLISGRLRGRGG